MPSPMAFLWIIFVLIAAGIIYWAVMQLPIPDPFRSAIRILVVVVVSLYVLFWLYGLISGYSTAPTPFIRR